MATAGQVRRPASSTDRFSGTPCASMAATGAVVVSNPAAKNTTGRPGWARAIATASSGEAIGRMSAPWPPRLHQRTRLAPRHVHRHAQHVAEGHQGGAAGQGDLHRMVDRLLRADADRAAGAGHQFDLRRQDRAQAGHGDRALMPATDVHHLDRPWQAKGAKTRQPLPGRHHETGAWVCRCGAPAG